MSVRTIAHKQDKNVMNGIVNQILKLEVTTLLIETVIVDRLKKEVIQLYSFKKMEILLIIILATLLTGCGGGGGSSTSTDSTIATSSVVEVQTKASIITENSATIEWIENDYTTELVEYGTSESYGSELLVQEEGTVNYKKSGSELVVENTVTLSDLEANTTYNYRIVGNKNGKKIVSNNKTFTTSETTSEPVVTEPAPEPILEPIVIEPTPEPIVPAPTLEPIETELTPETIPEPIVTEPAPEPIQVCKSGPAQQQGQIIDSISGAGLADVTITIAGCSTKTNTDGYYTLDNIVENENAVVNMEKEGYFLGSTEIQIKELDGDNTTSPNYLEYAIDTYNNQWSFDSQTSISGGNIEIPASVYTNTTGDLYNGVVSAALEIQDVTTDTGKKIFPGAFEGQNTNGEVQAFASHGLISLSFKDANGNPLNFSEGTRATLIFDSSSSMDGANIIPLWYYDYVQGLWIEEGYAELQVNGTYQGEISHPGTWSLNQPIENDPGIYTDRILYPDGTPVQNLRVSAVGKNWIRNDLSTDENGVFEIKVIPGEEFTLKAYHYTAKHSATYSGMISAIDSGEIANKIN